VLITRARRDARSPTIASRLWLRLQAMTGGLTRELRLERLVGTIDDPGRFAPADRPAPAPPLAARPKRIAVTDLDRLKADPFAFYAKTVLGLRPLEPVDADHTAAWKGSAVHRILEDWFHEDDCDPERILPRARALVAGDDIHPRLRALWAPRLEEAVRWLAEAIAEDREAGRRPLIAEVAGEAVIAGVTLYGRVDRIDRLADDKLAIVDYKTGKAPSGKAVREGFALQLGLLGLIAEHGGFAGASGESGAHEYWSLARKNGGSIGYRSAADEEMGAEAFLAHAAHHFAEAAFAWLTGSAPFTAKLHPAYAPYGDYDQMMRLDEWYGRVD
jgi:ATP-dependent helicase/nuclease subunit B